MIQQELEIPKFIPNIIRPSDLADIKLEPATLAQILTIMPPEEVLSRREFKEPEIIKPETFPDFNALLRGRERILRLDVLPLKTPDDRLRYHSQPKDQLIRQVQGYLGNESLALSPNLYPDNLPLDVGQYLLWTKRQEEGLANITEFVGKIMYVFRLGIDDVILFERSRFTSQSIVKGSFAEYRHIHFWRRMEL